MLRIAAFDSTPYAMPRAPSTNCATKPIASSSMKSVATEFLSLSTFCNVVLDEALKLQARYCRTRMTENSW
jgi:hypothetical protein